MYRIFTEIVRCMVAENNRTICSAERFQCINLSICPLLVCAYNDAYLARRNLRQSITHTVAANHSFLREFLNIIRFAVCRCQIDMYGAATIVRQFEHCFVQHDIIGPFILCIVDCRNLNTQLCHIVLDFSSINYLSNILSNAPYVLS